MSLERRTPLKRGGRLPAQSARRKAEKPARDECRREVLRRAGHHCEAERLPVHACGFLPDRRELEVDERHGGSRRSTEYLDPDQCQALCPVAHSFKTDNPKEAALVGLIDIDVQDRWLPEPDQGGGDVLEALRALARYEARLVYRRRLPSGAAFEGLLRDSLRAVAQARNARIRRTGGSAREWTVDDDGRLCASLPS